MHVPRLAASALVLASCVVVSSVVALPVLARDLTFDERVRAQEAIERVTYAHQVGATEPFEKVYTREVLEGKVDEDLRRSVALEQYWSTPLTAEALDREWARIVEGTHFPERLQEIVDALGGDAFLVRECFVRPVHVGRLIESFYASDGRIHGALRAAAAAARDAVVAGRSIAGERPLSVRLEFAPVPDDGAAALPRDGRVVTLPRAEFDRRARRLATGPGEVEESEAGLWFDVAVGSGPGRLLVQRYGWRKPGLDEWWARERGAFGPERARTVATDAELAAAAPRGAGSDPTGDGSSACTPADDWPTGTVLGQDVPRGVEAATAVWTGTEMIVYGGQDKDSLGSGWFWNMGGRYDPLTDTWRSLPLSPVYWRAHHTAVWTGSEMIVWGGGYRYAWSGYEQLRGDGARFNPATGAWTPVSSAGAPSPRAEHTAVMLGGRMIVWGGYDGVGALATGGIYDPASDTWTPTSSSGAPPARMRHTAVATASRMIVWGGSGTVSGSTCYGDGGAYDPFTDTWSALSATGAPAARDSHTAVWTDQKMVVWGSGGCIGGTGGSGAMYDPGTDTWQATSPSGAPASRTDHTAVWTGSRMIVWGGSGSGTGAQFDPVSNTWTPTSTTNVPLGRSRHVAVWANDRMIVWGGYAGSSGYTATGGRYSPSSNSWTPTRFTNSPTPRYTHTAVWSGSEMIVYGGDWPNSGGARYNPTTDAWTTLPTSNAPSPREGHVAVWTGDAMVVWGGYSATDPYTCPVSGRIYKVSTNAWSSMSETAVPPGRVRPGAVLAAGRVVIWGGYRYLAAGGHDFEATSASYNPSSNGWESIPPTSSPAPRGWHTMVSTGQKAIVWGGAEDAGTPYSYRYFGNGALYDPLARAWTPLSGVGAPGARADHTAAWTGVEMFVWSGTNGQRLASGGRYSPSNDRWSPVSTAGAPPAAQIATSVWTGNVVVVWGGYSGQPAGGGRYHPRKDAWLPVSTTRAPEPRYSHTAVAAGRSMIVWGGFGGAPRASGGLYDIAYYPDSDGDGWTTCDADCDDSSAHRNPGLDETCDGTDNDCDLVVDDGFDKDHDTFTTCGGDCRDDVAAIFPNAPERCDFLDNQCPGNPGYGVVDEGYDGDLDGVPACEDCAPGDPAHAYDCVDANFGRDSGSPITSDPVNAATGNFTDTVTDLSIAGPGFGFAFERTYNSQDAQDGPLGFGWAHSYDLRVSAGAEGVRTLRHGDGRVESYTPDGVGGYTPPYGARDRLVAGAGGTFSWTRKADRLRFDFDGSGRLAAIVDKNGNTLTCAYAADRLASVTDTAGRTIAFTYGPDGRLATMTDPIGRTVGYTYTPAGDLETVTDAAGAVTRYTSDANHQVLTVTDGRGNLVVSNTYDATSRVVSSQHDAYGKGTLFAYDKAARRTEVTDPYAQVTTYWFDEHGHTLRVRDPLGHELSYAYEPAGEKASMRDKGGAQTAFAYDANGNMLLRHDPDGAETRFTYDAQDRVASRTDPLGYVTTYDYDASGNLATTTDRAGAAEVRGYSGRGLLATLTDRRGKAWTFGHDPQGNLTAETDPFGRSESHGYDGAGRRTSTTDRNGHTTAFTYDGRDRLVTVTDALGGETVTTWDTNGNRTSLTDPLLHTTGWTYDLKNRLVMVRDPRGHETAYAYDDNDRRTAETDALGRTRTMGYDAVGNLTSETDALGRVTTHSYDALGRRLSTTEPGGAVTQFAYDAAGRLRRVEDPLQNVTEWTFDARGDKATAKDPLGRVTTYGYDAEQRLASVTDARGGRTSFGYDAEGHRTALTNANGHATTYAYDDAGRLTTTTDPLGNATAYGYDDVGNRTSRTDASQRLTLYAYDALNRNVLVSYPDGSSVATVYDAAGRRTSVTDESGTTVYGYDADGLASSVTDGSGRTLVYEHDAAHRRTSIGHPDGFTVSYGLDELGRVRTVTDSLGHAAHVAYTTAGDPDVVTLPNGTVEDLDHDAAHRLVRKEHRAADGSVIASFALTLDAAGRRTAVDGTTPVSGGMDDADDACAYDAAEQLISRGALSYQHDAQGNVVAAGALDLAYDVENRLVDAGGDRYVYDGDGARVRATRGGVETSYLLDRTAPLAQAVADYDGSGTRRRRHVLGPQLLWSIDEAGDAFVYHTDPVGSTVAVTDPAGTVVAAFDYDEFGSVTASSGGFSTDACFVGGHGVTREPSGLAFMRARFYEPGSGRFTARDPLETIEPVSAWASPYVYALNEPLGRIDPAGTYSWAEFGSDTLKLGRKVTEKVAVSWTWSAMKAGVAAVQTGASYTGTLVGRMAATTGGWNILGSVGKGLGGLISDKLIFDPIEGKGKSVPVLGAIPYIGPILFRYHTISVETVDAEGNVYDANGTWVGKLDRGKKREANGVDDPAFGTRVPGEGIKLLGGGAP